MFCCDSALLNVWLGVAVVIPENTYFFFSTNQAGNSQVSAVCSKATAKRPNSLQYCTQLVEQWSPEGSRGSKASQPHRRPLNLPDQDIGWCFHVLWNCTAK